MSRPPTVTAHVGTSALASPADAIDEAIAAVPDRALARFAIVYATVSYDADALAAALSAKLPGAQIVGTTSQGVSLSGDAIEGDRVLAVAVLSSHRDFARTASVTGIAADPRGAAESLTRAVGAPPGPRDTALLWYDPLTGANVDALLEGIAAQGFTRVWGAGAGQPWGPMVGTWQFHNGRAIRDGAVLAVLEGLEPVAAITHGVEPLGLEVTVTAAEAHVITEIDGRPALDVWQEQLGVGLSRHVDDTANWAIGIRVANDDGDPEGLVARAPFGVDEARGALVLQAPVPVGSQLQLCHRTRAGVYDRALRMADRLRDALGDSPAVIALSFECGARPTPFLGAAMAAREVREVQSRLPPGTPWIGTYAWGEIAPRGGRAQFHNFAFPLCVLREAA